MCRCHQGHSMCAKGCIQPAALAPPPSQRCHKPGQRQHLHIMLFNFVSKSIDIAGFLTVFSLKSSDKEASPSAPGIRGREGLPMRPWISEMSAGFIGLRIIFTSTSSEVPMIMGASDWSTCKYTWHSEGVFYVTRTQSLPKDL